MREKNEKHSSARDVFLSIICLAEDGGTVGNGGNMIVCPSSSIVRLGGCLGSMYGCKLTTARGEVWVPDVHRNDRYVKSH
jgi:hypothetical protein